ncbi:hypothetical protein ACHAWF_017103 [Thalassiosira exigua]
MVITHTRHQSAYIPLVSERLHVQDRLLSLAMNHMLKWQISPTDAIEGYGPEPDSALLMAMAKVTSGGSFYSIRDNTQVASAFGDAIGGILSVVAQNVTLTINVPEETMEHGAEIVAIHHDKKREVSDGVFQVDLGDLYAEESRDVLFDVTLATPKKTSDDETQPLCHALVKLSYVDTIKHSFVGPLTGTAVIARPNDDDLGWPNHHVAKQWMRVRTAKVISEAEQLAKIGDFERARTKIESWLEEFQKESFEIGSKEEDSLLLSLREDLTDCLDVLKASDYNPYVENELGVRVQAHFSQRCSEPQGKRNVYRTAQKSFRAQAFERRTPPSNLATV